MRTTKNGSSYAMETDQLRAVCLPGHGGKLVSIVHKQNDFELLFQNPNPAWSKADIRSSFEEHEACGFDDAFPSIDPEYVRIGDRTVRYPDHGEVWSTAMESAIEDGALKLSFDSVILPYHYEKRIRLEDGAIILNYSITNRGGFSFPAFWTMHCLVRIEPGMRIFLPAGTGEVLNVMDGYGAPLGKAGARLAYPGAGGRDLSLVTNATQEGTCSKFYLNRRLEASECGYLYPGQNMKVTIRTDLPYLGFWKTLGGFRGDRNCALEPSQGFYDSISTALANGACPILEPGESTAFTISMKLETARGENP